ncbi:YbhB/YbcL family Raf kinase inhibitor-like protein [Rahnella sikkimica]|uniref:Phospholipid-binding protein n=1 Tax=Rahnella sikkimica TaxID=1805933 RepID=A0A2L1UKY4_9GAMM|nr:YbhB/YbcL family Raf kinase inhibitor-like protein [Rahnella sikkimica]AVF33582.1 phospholipid-binding protein [Rahnella sikkimica]
MKLISQNFENGAPMPGELAFAVQDAVNHLTLSTNRNPHLAWSDVPENTRSFALICVDPHVPSRPDDVNQEGKVVSASLPRIDLFHWLLINIPADTREIAEGSHSDSVTPKGKPALPAEAGMRHGINGYTAWFGDDENMGGDYYGYDGACPPWNDEIAHDYVFTLYALDIPELELQGKFYGPDVLAAIDGHVLAQASLTGTYTLNPDVK